MSGATGIGLVGYGYWGPNLARNFSSLPKCRLVAICDLSEKRRAAAQAAYPSTTVTADFQSLLANPDIHAVVIATPVSHHYPLAMAALSAGKDVLVEKPFTQTSEQGQKLIAEAQRLGRLIAVDHTFLFTGAVQKIKELVDRQELGDLLYFDSVRINLGLFQEDVNVIYDLPRTTSPSCCIWWAQTRWPSGPWARATAATTWKRWPTCTWSTPTVSWPTSTSAGWPR